MKFGKEFKNQKVPEWIEAYVDYNGLKHILHACRLLEQTRQPQTPLRVLQQKLTMRRPFSGLIQQQDVQSIGDVEDQVISTNAVLLENSRKIYSTRFLLSPEDGQENDILFFQKLDDELNKVNNFYKDKVEEVMKEANLLNRQMDALVALRIKVMNRDSDAPSSLISLSTDIESLAPSKVTTPSRAGSEAFAEILARVKISNTLGSPMSTIRGLLKDSREKDLRFKKQELREVEERLKVAFIEFYQKLHLLKHFSFMNLSAFSKILKKYEKVTSRKVARSYIKMVDDSYLGSSEEVISLLSRVEEIFVKHFSNSNRREGMKLLRPKRRREMHRITFCSGFFSGCSVALLVAVILIIQAKKIADREETNLHVDTIFPLYSFYAYIVLHMLLYAGNIYFWKRYRINYSFIFGFKQGTELGYREVFLLSNGLAMLVLATFLAHLHLKMDPRSRDNPLVEFFPMGLIIILLGLVFFPFNILYRSSRFFLVRCMFRCVCAPLYKVTLSDFFLADQLTSQVQAIRSLEYYMCYYISGNYSRESNMCHNNDVYNVFYFIIAVIPYWSRFLQCIRRLVEEKDRTQGFNSLRYLSTIIAVVIRTAFELKKTSTWEAFAVVFSVIATLVNTYWDIVMDWGLLQRNSKNLFLRDKLVVSHKSVYFIAMVLDVLLRFAWLQLVVTFDIHSLRGIALASLFSCLEIIRRGMWNFFRLENEHLNNVGKYRAFKSVPLPFLYHDDTVESDDKDD